MTDYTNIASIYECKTRLKTITCRVSDQHLQHGPGRSILNARDAATIVRGILDSFDDDQEHVVMLVLAANGKVKGFKHISSGGMGSADVDARIVFRSALLLGAFSIVLVHNHPSGNVQPSREDIHLTKVMIEAGRLMGLGLLDHVIITKYEHYSLCEHSYEHDLNF